ncbi:MAG TPA: M56 family metallopeptidase [Vicinamibacteria bacterium]
MSPRLLLVNTAAWWAQCALVTAAVAGLLRITKLGAPAARLWLWRAVLVTVLALPALQWWRGGTDGVPSAAVVDAVFGPAARGGGIDLALLAVLALAAGSALRVLRLAVGLCRLARWAHDGEPYQATDIRAEVIALAGADADLRLSPAVAAPATFGWRRPVVLVPPDFPARPRAQRRDALAHELLHVRPADWAETVAEETVSALLWFQPAVACIAAELRLAREELVDAAVVARTHGRRAYAETLLALAAPSPLPALAASLFSAPLERRIESLLKEEPMTRRKLTAALAASAIGLLAAAVTAAWAVPLQAAATAGQKRMAERKLVQKVNPVYPPEAKTKHIQGIVLLDVLISAAGDVTDAKPTKGPEELREAAASAVRQWKYEPADKDTRATITVRFLLDSKKEKPKP